MAAYRTVADWAMAGSVDSAPVAQAVKLASVVIRLDGRIVGKGWAEGETDVISAAAKRAIAGAEGAIPHPRDLISEAAGRAESRSRCQVSVELADAYVPFSPKTFDDVDKELSPGLDGVAVRIGERFEAMFPEAMLVARMTPGDALASAIARAADNPAVGLRVDPKGQPADVARERGAVFYRFRPVQIAEVGGVARFLYRGGEIFRESEVTTPMLREYAGRLAAYLLAQRLPTDNPAAPQFRGPVLPSQGRYETETAGDAEQLLVAWSLLKYELLDLTDVHAGETTALELLAQLARRDATTAEPRFLSSIGAAAMWAVVASEAFYATEQGDGGKARWRPEWSACRERIVSLCTNLEELPPGQRGLVAYALARIAVSENSDALREGARIATLKALELTPPPAMPAEMPWLGWAALESFPPTEALGPATALREFRDLCYKHQLSPTSPGPERRDMAGGIMLAGNTSFPTWASARPVAFVCAMLGDPRVTLPDERAREIARLIPALRYLRQLSADPSVARLHAEPTHSTWGVRAALWDFRQPPEATAMTLVALCEVIRSLDQGSAAAK